MESYYIYGTLLPIMAYYYCKRRQTPRNKTKALEQQSEC